MIGYEGRRVRQAEMRGVMLDCSGEPMELGQDPAEAFEQNAAGRSKEDLTVAGAVIGNMVVTSVTSGEPSSDHSTRDKFNNSDFRPEASIGKPYAGDYDFRKVIL